MISVVSRALRPIPTVQASLTVSFFMGTIRKIPTSLPTKAARKRRIASSGALTIPSRSTLIPTQRKKITPKKP